jgi:hypothetical protein
VIDVGGENPLFDFVSARSRVRAAAYSGFIVIEAADKHLQCFLSERVRIVALPPACSDSVNCPRAGETP